MSIKNISWLVALAIVGVGFIPNQNQAEAYGGGICINCGFIQPVEIKVPKTVCTDVLLDAKYTFTRDLTLRSKGADVTALQEYLEGAGYKKSSVTGYYDIPTMWDVLYFQKDNGLRPTGRVDSKVRALLNKGVAQHECHIEYETVLVKSRKDLNDIHAKIMQVIRDIVSGKGLHK